MTRTVGMRPITLLVCFLCLIGWSVSATYLIMHVTYRSQFANKDREVLSVQKNNAALADQNGELRNSLQKLENEYTKLESQYRDLESRFDTSEQKNIQTASKLAAASKDRETAKADSVKLSDDLEAKLSKIEALNADLQALEQKYSAFKEMLAPDMALEPTWVSPGETTQAFDGNLLIVLYETSEKDKCRKGSAAAGYLIHGTSKNKVCLRLGKPESFKYQGKNYGLNLLESKESEGAHRYCIYIMKER